MNPFNPNNPNPNNPNPNQPNLFSTLAYTPTIDPSWVSPQFTFSAFQQSPNAFKQMSQVQQMQQYQALQQFMQRNSFEQFQSQPPTSQPQPPVQLDNDDEEVVPESPPKELKRKKNMGKGKAVETVAETAPKSGLRAKPRPWTKIEEEALAMAFVKSSTCPIIVNNQTGISFWKATMERFNGIMEQGPMRDLDSVSSKWRKMSKAINTFSGYYNQIYTNPPSGSNDEYILNLALAKWDSKNSYRKGQSKKRGGRKAKGGGSSGGGSSGGGVGSGAGSKMDELISEFSSFKELATEKYSYKKTLSADYARAEDFRIMRLDLDSVPEDKREVYRRMKEEVKKKWTS